MTIANPLVTVSIPIYKCEKYIERCLRSVFIQTYPNIEILLVNDQTRDGGLEIVEKLCAEHPEHSIRILHNDQNCGLSVVRNRGIDEAEGELLYFLDSDGVITVDCIEKLVQKQLETDATMVIGGVKTVNTFGSSESKFQLPITTLKTLLSGNPEVFRSFFDGEWPVPAWNKLIKVDFFRKNSLYFVPGLFSQDELWSFHVALKLDSVAFVKDVTYHYYLHSESVIHNKSRINFENHQTIADYFAKAYNAEPDALRRLFIKRYLLRFKEMTLIMQYKAMREDEVYWKENYSRLKKLPKLTVSEYLTSFSLKDKKNDLLLRLPTPLGYKIFKWRWGD